MTRGDYVMVARVIVDEVERAEDLDVIGRIAGGLADVFAADNPRFDRARFLTACGLD